MEHLSLLRMKFISIRDITIQGRKVLIKALTEIKFMNNALNFLAHSLLSLELIPISKEGQDIPLLKDCPINKASKPYKGTTQALRCLRYIAKDQIVLVPITNHLVKDSVPSYLIQCVMIFKEGHLKVCHSK